MYSPSVMLLISVLLLPYYCGGLTGPSCRREGAVKEIVAWKLGYEVTGGCFSPLLEIVAIHTHFFSFEKAS